MTAISLKSFCLDHLGTIFNQYGQVKLSIDSPAFINYFLLFGFIFITLGTLKKVEADQPFSFLQTEQVKGVAIIMIVIHHLYTYVLQDYAELNIVSGMLGPSGVAIFLILSGFGIYISLNGKGIKNFFYKRVIKIYVPIVLAMSLHIILNHTFLPLSPNIVTEFIKIFTNLPQLDKNMWFILFILFWYCIIFWTFKLNLSNQQRILCLSLFSLIILTMPRISPSWKINAFSFPIGCWLGLNSAFVINRVKIYLKQPLIVIFGVLGSLLFGTVMLKIVTHQSNQTYFLRIALIAGVLAGAYFGYRAWESRRLQAQIPTETLSMFLVILAIFPYLKWSFASTVFEFQEIPHWLLEGFPDLLLTVFIILLISLMTKFSVYSAFLSFIGGIAFEIYLLHGMFMYSFDFVLFRGSIYFTFLVYFLAICLMSVLLQRVSLGVSKLLFKH